MHRKINMNPTTTCSVCMIYLNIEWICHLKNPLADFNLRKTLKKYFKNVVYNYLLSDQENLLQVFYVNEIMGAFIIRPCV